VVGFYDETADAEELRVHGTIIEKKGAVRKHTAPFSCSREGFENPPQGLRQFSLLLHPSTKTSGMRMSPK